MERLPTLIWMTLVDGHGLGVEDRRLFLNVLDDILLHKMGRYRPKMSLH